MANAIWYLSPPPRFACIELKSKLWQVRHLLRPVGPEEYDAATACLSNLCPLYALGDLRSGTQLLNESEADAQLSLQGLRDRRVKALVLRVQEKCGHLELELSQRAGQYPFGFSYSSGHSTVSESYHARQITPRSWAGIPTPIGMVAGIFLNGAEEIAFRRLTQQVSIGSPLVAGLRAAYKMEELVEIFDPLPPTFKALLKRATEALQVREIQEPCCGLGLLILACLDVACSRFPFLSGGERGSPLLINPAPVSRER